MTVRKVAISLCFGLLCLTWLPADVLFLPAAAQSSVSRKGTSPSAGVALQGVIKDAKSGEPLPGVAVKLDDGALWALTDVEGRYAFDGLADGRYRVETDYLGYVSAARDIRVSRGQVRDPEDGSVIRNLDFLLQVQSLALQEVIVTSTRSKTDLNTSVNIGRDALNHLQLGNVTEIGALLPGGKTVNPDLTVDNTLSLRDGGVSTGNAAFGAALEVDGVRMGNNASLGELSGISTRSISVDNIESVEVITGVPSAEYGDLNSGMVKVRTKKGRTPVHITLSANPRTWQASVSKGVELGTRGGVLNLSGEWARATTKLTSPYTSYTRRGLDISYSNTFFKTLRFEAGVSGNIGGMNSEDDPDAFHGSYTKGSDNVVRASTSLDWLLKKSWITSLRIEASLYYHDRENRVHAPRSSASSLPAPHSEEEGYFLARSLPLNYFYDQVIDSRELDYSASLKYRWLRRWGEWKNELKAGIQWKADGNVGKGEYYENPDLSPAGYRPRPYSQYPYMHNVSYYLEDHVRIPISARVRLELTAGARLESVYVKGSRYDHIYSLSPRFNGKFHFGEHWSLRGGWGISEKLPSFFVLYPKQEYLDIQTFSMSHATTGTSYVYYTRPYSLAYSDELKWQRSSNSELAVEAEYGGFKFSLVGFYNLTRHPYQYDYSYLPFQYNMYAMPAGFTPGENPQLRVDRGNGQVSVRNEADGTWTDASLTLTDRTFFKQMQQSNGADVTRTGVELTADFPEIRPIRTTFRLDGAYTYTYFLDDGLTAYYPSVSQGNRSYPYVGIYALPNPPSLVNGSQSHSIDANLTAIVRIPEARLVLTARLETSLLKRSRNLSECDGREYAFNTVSAEDRSRAGGSIYDAGSQTAVWPLAYQDLNGRLYLFTEEALAADPTLRSLVLVSGNAYLFSRDGYGIYWSANLSVTKEIGDHVSLSFFANNFTNNRQAVTSLATGISTIFTPSFYYGITCRLKF